GNDGGRIAQRRFLPDTLLLPGGRADGHEGYREEPGRHHAEKHEAHQQLDQREPGGRARAHAQRTRLATDSSAARRLGRTTTVTWRRGGCEYGNQVTRALLKVRSPLTLAQMVSTAMRASSSRPRSAARPPERPCASNRSEAVMLPAAPRRASSSTMRATMVSRRVKPSRDIGAPGRWST